MEAFLTRWLLIFLILDVYKRQEQYGFTSPEQLDAAITAAYADLHDSTAELKTVEAAIQGKKELQGYVPVSYTHLDVYKRQPLNRSISFTRLPRTVWVIRSSPD